MTLILAYAAGLLTLINPCVLPVLPIVLASALQASRFGPLALAAGLGSAFVIAGLALGSLAGAFGLSPDTITQVGAAAMVAFGLTQLLPVAGRGFAFATAGLAARADRGAHQLPGSGVGGQFLGGMLLGLIWSPCVGPTLGGALALAASGRDLGQAAGIMVAFSLGVGTVVVALGYGARGLLIRNRARMQRVAQTAKPVLGAAFVLVGLALLTGMEHPVEGWLLSITPDWIQNLSVSI